MPTTRRSTGAAGKQQSTLSFNHRVTKPVPKSAKPLVTTTTTPTKQSPLGKHVSKAEAEAEADDDEEPAVDVDEAKAATTTAKPEQQAAEAEEKKSEAELRAQKIGDRRIEQYWRGLESERMTRRVHQEDLSLAEKVLRYWDVSSQYGVCKHIPPPPPTLPPPSLVIFVFTVLSIHSSPLFSISTCGDEISFPFSLIY